MGVELPPCRDSNPKTSLFDCDCFAGKAHDVMTATVRPGRVVTGDWMCVREGDVGEKMFSVSWRGRSSPSILSGTLISDSRAPLRHVNHAGRWSDDSSDWSDCDSHRWGRRESDRTFSILALDRTLKSILWLPFGLFLNRPTSYLCSEAQRQDGVLKGRVSVHVRRNAWNYHTHTFRFKLIWCQIELEMLLETN